LDVAAVTYEVAAEAATKLFNPAATPVVEVVKVKLACPEEFVAPL
jgi:hypothetical protein